MRRRLTDVALASDFDVRIDVRRDAEGRDPAMGSQPRPLAFREMREDEQLVAHFLQAIGNRAHEGRRFTQ